MQMLITSTVDDAAQILQKLGYLAIPTDEDNIFQFEVESLEELFHLKEIIGHNLIVSGNIEYPIIEIANDYR